MVDLTSLVDFSNASTVLAWAAIVLAAIGVAINLRYQREAKFRARQIELLSRSIEQLTRLAVMEYSGITNLGKSLASALNPTGESDMRSPAAKAAYQALGPEPDRVLEEAEIVLGQAAKAMGWKYVPGVQQR